MSEFDLRPFEIMKDLLIVEISENERPWENARADNGLFDTQKEAREHLIWLLSEEIDRDKIQFPFSQFRIRKIKKEWTFEDIQPGLFFKISFHDDGFGTPIFFKKDNDWVFELDFGILEADMPCLESHAFETYQDERSGFDITNVYDCQELAKVLMIERIVT